MADIDETNFREAAQRAIEAYHKKGALLDSLLWARIIGLYEAALEKASKGVAK